MLNKLMEKAPGTVFHSAAWPLLGYFNLQVFTLPSKLVSKPSVIQG